MMGQHAWKIRPSSTDWGVIKTQQPKQYHEMSEQTVPSALRQVVKKVLSVQQNSHIIWAVELPTSITRMINQVVKGKEGGLVIEGNGKVVLK